MAGIKRPRASPATLRRLAALLAPYRWRLVAAGVALLVASALQLAIAPLAGSLTDAIHRAAGTGHTRVLFELAAAILGSVLLRSGITYAYQYLLNGTAQRLGIKLREAVFEQTLRMSHRFFDDRETGAVVARLSSDVPMLQGQIIALIGDSI